MREGCPSEDGEEHCHHESDKRGPIWLSSPDEGSPQSHGEELADYGDIAKYGARAPSTNFRSGKKQQRRSCARQRDEFELATLNGKHHRWRDATACEDDLRPRQSKDPDFPLVSDPDAKQSNSNDEHHGECQAEHARGRTPEVKPGQNSCGYHHIGLEGSSVGVTALDRCPIAQAVGCEGDVR